MIAEFPEKRDSFVTRPLLLAPDRAGAPPSPSCSGLWSSFSKGQMPIPERVLFIHDFLSGEKARAPLI